jgi:hypothetical protein
MDIGRCPAVLPSEITSENEPLPRAKQGFTVIVQNFIQLLFAHYEYSLYFCTLNQPQNSNRNCQQQQKILKDGSKKPKKEAQRT